MEELALQVNINTKELIKSVKELEESTYGLRKSISDLSDAVHKMNITLDKVGETN